MTNETKDKTIADQLFEVAQSLPSGSAKTRALRNAQRHRIMDEKQCEWFEVILNEDRDESSFDSKGLYETIHRLDLEEQKRLQLGIQMMNMYDGFSCGILIGGYAKVYFTNVPLLTLKPQMTFVITKYDRLLKYCSTNGINTIVSNDKTFFEIPTHGCKVFDSSSNPLFDNILADMRWANIFASKVVLSPDESLWNID